MFAPQTMPPMAAAGGMPGAAGGMMGGMAGGMGGAPGPLAKSPFPIGPEQLLQLLMGSRDPLGMAMQYNEPQPPVDPTAQLIMQLLAGSGVDPMQLAAMLAGGGQGMGAPGMGSPGMAGPPQQVPNAPVSY